MTSSRNHALFRKFWYPAGRQAKVHARLHQVQRDEAEFEVQQTASSSASVIINKEVIVIKSIVPMDLETHSTELVERGFTLVSGIGDNDAAVALVENFGVIIPQYGGAFRHEVKAVAGFENLQYSKSVNTILAHTEAPGWNPPPQYLALHCRVQARCGGGYTDLADGYAFLDSMAPEVRDIVEKRMLYWPGQDTAEVPGVHASIVGTDHDGRRVVRFSYNLLSTGSYEPSIGSLPDPAALPLGSLGVDLAMQAAVFFDRTKTSILLQENTVLIWDNQRMFHARSAYRDTRRHLTRYWMGENR